VTDLHTPGQITDALLSTAQTFFGAVKVYDHTVPGDAGKMYLLMQSIDGGTTSGPPLTDPDADIDMVFQFDCVATRRDAAQYLQGRLYAFLLGRNADGSFATPVTIPTSRRVAARMLNSAPGGVQVQGTPPQYLYVTQDRFTLTITPSP
jgi:hypothetical protein